MFYFIFILLFPVVDLQSTPDCPADTGPVRADSGAGSGHGDSGDDASIREGDIFHKLSKSASQNDNLNERNGIISALSGDKMAYIQHLPGFGAVSKL